jgi:hypothetical protein
MRVLLPALLLDFLATAFSSPALAQQRPAQPESGNGSPIKPEIVVDPAPSFSSFKLKLTRSKSHHASAKDVTKTFEVQFTLPFRSSPFGAPVTESGLGAVESAQLLVTLLRTDAMSRIPRPVNPADSLLLLAAIGHRGFDAPGAGTSVYHVDRLPYAFGLAWKHEPGNPKTFVGRLRMGLGVQYRRQYLPADPGGAPIGVDNVIVDAGVDGAVRKLPFLPYGFGYSFKAGYDVLRGVPGAEVALNTMVLTNPRLVVGVSFWFQGRDDNARTRDKRFDLAPHLSLQF